MRAALLELMTGGCAQVPFGIRPARAVGRVAPLTLVPGTRTLAPSPAGATGSVASLSLVPGTRTLSPGPAGAVGGVPDPVLESGGGALTPGPAGAVGSVPEPAWDGGLQSLAPSPAAAVGSAAPVMLTPGTRTLAPSPAGAVGTAAPVTLAPGSRALAPSPAVAWGGALDPELYPTTAVTIAPAPAGATGSVTTPALENVGSSLAVEITSPSPPVALYSGVGQGFSGTFTGSPSYVRLYWDSGYTQLAATASLGSGTWTATVTPAYAQVGLTTLYCRAYDGSGYAYDDCTITVTQRTPLTLFAAIRSRHRADDPSATLTGGSPNKFDEVPDEKIATSNSRLYQSTDSLRWLVRSSDSNFAGRRTAYVDSAFGSNIVMLPGSTSQVFGQRSGGKVTTIAMACCEYATGNIGVLQTGTGSTYGWGRYTDGTLVFVDGGTPRTTSHTLRVNVPFALRVEWDDTNNLANWYIRYNDGVTASGSVTWSTAADYSGMYVGATGYGWRGAFCEIDCMDGALGSGEWDAYVAQWLQGRHGWT